MKKIIYFSLLIGLFGFSAQLLSKESEQIAITKTEGEVQAKQAAQWLKAKPKMELAKGDALKTGLDSYAEIQLNPQNRFRIKEETEVSIEKVLEQGENASGSIVKLVDFNLKKGTLLAKLEKLPKGVELHVGSPTAIAGASGTEFSVSVASYGHTHVAVLESQVRVTSSTNPKQATFVEPFQKVDVAPWKTARLKAKGTGILSEKILGKNFVTQTKQDIMIAAVGIASPPGNALPEEQDKLAAANAHLAALSNLTDRILDIEIGREQKISDLIEENVALAQQLYRAISQARIVRSQKLSDGTTQEELEINLNEISKAIDRPITTIYQTVRPLTLAEYGAKFGALARVTTRRAAQIDAMRKLAEQIYGSVVDSKTTVKDLEAADDRIVTVVQGIVRGAEIIGETYFSDGSVSVVVEALGEQIKTGLTNTAGNIFGDHYMSSPKRIVIKDFETYKELEKI